MEFKHLISIITVVMIPVPKMSKSNKLPFLLNGNFPLGMPNRAANACYNKKISKSKYCFFKKKSDYCLNTE